MGRPPSQTRLKQRVRRPPTSDLPSPLLPCIGSALNQISHLLCIFCHRRFSLLHTSRALFNYLCIHVLATDLSPMSLSARKTLQPSDEQHSIRISAAHCDWTSLHVGNCPFDRTPVTVSVCRVIPACLKQSSWGRAIWRKGKQANCQVTKGP